MIEFEKVHSAIKVTGWSRLSAADARNHAHHLFREMAYYEVNNARRVAAFLAQWAHETGGWRWMRELGGPSYFLKYEGRKDLGNTQLGDGQRFKGRGYNMLTGRSNYLRMEKRLNLPLLEQPELAEQPQYAARISSCWWQDHGLNELADHNDFRLITRIINGGYHSYENRLRMYLKLKQI